ncbi:MAG: GNAT family N-acetyltransferase [Janthinobacterium lividum]
MLRLLSFSALDLARWDACLVASPGAPPYAQAWWLAATAGRWAAVVELGPAGEYCSLLPLPYKWRPRGRVGYQPLFTQQLGLVLTPASQHRTLADYLELAAQSCGAFYQQLAPAAGPWPALPAGFRATGRLTYCLDLGLGATQLQAGYAPDYRRRLRRLGEAVAPLVVIEGIDLEEIIQLFLTYKGPAATGLHPRHYAPLRRLWAAARQRGLAELRQVRHPATDELLAGALFIKHVGGVIYLFAAASAAGRAAGAPLLLLDDALRRHAGQPGHIFDFEGGSQPEIGRFFANFGARPVLYPAISYFSQPWFFAWKRP